MADLLGSDVRGSLSLSGQIKSSYLDGAPFDIESTTMVTNLNADLLDGYHASYFLNIGNMTGGTLGNARLPARLQEYNTTSTAANSATLNGFYYVNNGDTNRPSFSQSTNKDYKILTSAYSAAWVQQIAMDFRCDDVFYRRCENGTWKNWVKFTMAGEALPISGGTLTGTLTANAGTSGNGIKWNGNNTNINSLSNQLLVLGSGIRFGAYGTWDWSAWAGLKYDHANKKISLGLADGTTFNANTAQSDGTLDLPGISTVTIGDTSLATVSYVSGLIGDINTILDSLVTVGG